MRFSIDVLFLNGDQAVVHQATMAPWRLSRWVPSARGVLELPAGTLARTETQAGDRVALEEVR